MKKSVLILYYSHSGVTKRVAEQLQQKTGGHLYEVRTPRIYDPDMWKANDQAMAERETGKLPEVSGNLPDLTDYDLILIGGPSWGGTMANPLMSYLSQTDFSGKAVAPFWTYMDYDGTYNEDMKRQCKNAEMKPGLGLTHTAIRSADFGDKLDAWLKSVCI